MKKILCLSLLLLLPVVASADSKLSNLSSSTSPATSDLTYTVIGGQSKSMVIGALPPLTASQVNNSTPTQVGQIIYCTNCVQAYVCVSTLTTTAGSYAIVQASMTAAPQACK